MLKRLVRGLLEGGICGLVVAFAISGLGASWTAVVAYVAAAVVGASTGLLAGKPVWREGAKVEGALKAVVSAFIGMVVLFGIRKWWGSTVWDLGAFAGGRAPVGELPRVALPAIGVALAWVLEIDDAFGPDPAPVFRKRVAERGTEETDDEAAEEAPRERRARNES